MWRMEPTGSNNGVVQISVANDSVPNFKNIFKVLLWAILVKKEAKKRCGLSTNPKYIYKVSYEGKETIRIEWI